MLLVDTTLHATPCLIFYSNYGYAMAIVLQLLYAKRHKKHIFQSFHSLHDLMHIRYLLFGAHLHAYYSLTCMQVSHNAWRLEELPKAAQEVGNIPINGFFKWGAGWNGISCVGFVVYWNLSGIDYSPNSCGP